MIPRQTSRPMKSASSSGPIGWLSPTRAPASMSSARADALLEGAHRLGEERHQDPVDDEARPVGRDDDLLAELGGERADGVGRRVASSRSRGSSSTSGMTGTGLKKCIPTNRARRASPTAAAQAVDRDRARVRGEDRAGRRDAGRARDQSAALDLEVLEDRLDDEVGVARRRPRSAVGAIRPRMASRSLAVEPALRDGPLEVAGDPVAARLRPGEVGLVQRRRSGRRGEDLGDAVAHQPGAGDEDALDRHRSSLASAAAPSRRRVARPISSSAAAYGSEPVFGDRGERLARRPSRIALGRGAARNRSPTIAQTCASARARRAAAARPGVRGRRGAGRGRRAAPGRRRRSWRSSTQDLGPLRARALRPTTHRPRRPRGGDEHRPELGGGPLRAGPVALVHDDEVGDLEQPGLDRLDLVAHLGRLEDDRRVGRGRDLDLALAGPDGLDEDQVEARPRRAPPPRRRSWRRDRRRGRGRPSSG